MPINGMNFNTILTTITLLYLFPYNSFGHEKEQNNGTSNHQNIYLSSNQDSIPDLLAEDIRFDYIRPLAIKTNLLFDLATIINIEAEVPVAPRWSVAGEWIFPWWIWESKQRALQVLSGNLEVRYWFKPDYKKQDISLPYHNPLTGWFAGLFGGGGLYDVEWDKKGYQGDFFITTGLTAGYVAPLSRNLNMEFSLGVGYFKTHYRHYNAIQDDNKEWHLVKQYPGNYSWVGSVKAKIALVWYPHFKKKRRQ